MPLTSAFLIRACPTVPRFGGARTREGDRVLVSLAQNPPGVSSPRPSSPGRRRGCLFVDSTMLRADQLMRPTRSGGYTHREGT